MMRASVGCVKLDGEGGGGGGGPGGPPLRLSSPLLIYLVK